MSLFVIITFFRDDNPKKRKRGTSWQLSSKCGNSENQYQIDAGQKMFGATQCNECGIIYHIGDPDDENAHLNYHNSFKILKFQVLTVLLTLFIKLKYTLFS